MSSHQATEQMLGYLYQVQYALELLLSNENSSYQISIEKFDDVAFEEDGQPKQLIQLKHHVKQRGNLTDGSADLWRTIKVWIDFLSQKPELIGNTEFFIITTAIAPENSIAWCLKHRNSKIETVYKKMFDVCKESTSDANKKFYNAFLEADSVILYDLIEHIRIIDGASNIKDLESKIKKQIRYSSLPKFEDLVYERLVGWWYKKVIAALSSENPIFVTQNQVRGLIISINQEYANDNLPIEDFNGIDDLQESYLNEDEKNFCKQLKLISANNSRIKIAIKDYYRAYYQRASWIRNDLLYVNELDGYERRLIDEWEHAFAEMEDDLSEFEAVTDKEKSRAGRKLLTEIEGKDIRIRPKCQDAFIMRGSYHMLADELKVGWHIDFLERLKNLLDE